jgi:hypothetical protein
MRMPALTIVLFALLFPAPGQELERPNVPEKLKAKDWEKLVLMAHATGAQTYTCVMTTSRKYGWALKVGEAELRDEKGSTVGFYHEDGLGPSWKHRDGSEISGKTMWNSNAREPNALPWSVWSGQRQVGNGILSRVTTVQRIHTTGGALPPNGDCDESRRGTDVSVPSSADYYFYAAPQ